MKRFKKTDFEISVILIIVCTAFAFLKGGASFFIGYVVVGAWQLISMLVHYYNDWFCEKGGKRLNYQTTVIVALSSAIVGLIISPIILIVAVVLLFAAPVMAIYYTWICYEETYIKMRRPLDLLK